MKCKIAFIFGLICLAVLRLEGFQMIEQNLQTITQRSSVILRGKCESRTIRTIYPEAAPNGIMVTHYVFSVTEALKGSPSNPFEFDVYGVSRQEARKTSAPYMVGFVQFEAGKEYVVFLTGPTRLGVWAPMGLTQGVFDVVYAEDGKATVVSKHSMRPLFKGMAKTARTTKALKAANVDANNPPKGPIPYEDLKTLVEMLK